MSQEKWDRHYENNDEIWTTPDETLIAIAENLPIGRALDLGAGEGADAIWLADRGWKVTAVDFSSAAISTIQRLAEDRRLEIETVVANVTKFRSDNRYNLIYICYMHLPTEDRKKNVGECVRSACRKWRANLHRHQSPDRRQRR